MSMLPMYQSERRPIAWHLSESGFNLPTFIGMTRQQINVFCEEFLKAVERQR